MTFSAESFCTMTVLPPLFSFFISNMPATRPVSTKRFDVPAPPPNSPNERVLDVVRIVSLFILFFANNSQLWRWSALDDAVDSIWIDELQVVPSGTQCENWKQKTDSHAASDTTDTSILTLHQTQSENSKSRTNRLSPSNTTNTSILTLHQNRSNSSTPDRLPSRTAYGSVVSSDNNISFRQLTSMSSSCISFESPSKTYWPLKISVPKICVPKSFVVEFNPYRRVGLNYGEGDSSKGP